VIGIDVRGFINWLGELGVTGLVIFVLVALQQGWLRFPREVAQVEEALAAMTKDRDEWKARYFAAMGVGERAANVATVALPAGEAGGV
jgi:hypothetical protein